MLTIFGIDFDRIEMLQLVPARLVVEHNIDDGAYAVFTQAMYRVLILFFSAVLSGNAAFLIKLPQIK